jgi:hypothetical protein
VPYIVLFAEAAAAAQQRQELLSKIHGQYVVIFHHDQACNLEAATRR